MGKAEREHVSRGSQKQDPPRSHCPRSAPWFSQNTDAHLYWQAALLVSSHAYNNIHMGRAFLSVRPPFLHADLPQLTCKRKPLFAEQIESYSPLSSPLILFFFPAHPMSYYHVGLFTVLQGGHSFCLSYYFSCNQSRSRGAKRGINLNKRFTFGNES